MLKDNFPKEILSHRQWLDWREERCPKAHRLVKVPYDPKTGYHASSVDPVTWATIDEAIASVEKYKLHGIGYVFTEANGIIGVDLDKCIIDGKLNEIATVFLEKAPRTYIELSPSGKGLHALIRGKLPPGCGKGKKNKHSQNGRSQSTANKNGIRN